MVYSVVIDDNIDSSQLLLLHGKLPEPIVGKVAFLWLLFFDYSSVVNEVRNRNFNNLVLVQMDGYFVLSDRKLINSKRPIVNLF